jgi:hypothetical protein
MRHYLAKYYIEGHKGLRRAKIEHPGPYEEACNYAAKEIGRIVATEFEIEARAGTFSEMDEVPVNVPEVTINMDDFKDLRLDLIVGPPGENK